MSNKDVFGIVDIRIRLIQRTTLLRYFFIPLWRASIATALLVIGLLLLSGGWVLSPVLVVFCGFSVYMISRFQGQLKQLQQELSEAIPISSQEEPEKKLLRMMIAERKHEKT